MDSLTQIALGAATAEVVAGEKLKNRTLLYGAILGTLPDLDVIVGGFMSDVDGVAIHRGFSHSVLFFVFLAPLLGYAISKIEKGKIDIKSAAYLVFWCLATHVLLDMFTSWGTQVLWPMDIRFAFKTIFVVDPLYTFPLLISLVYVFRTKEAGNREKYIKRGLMVSGGYLIVTCVLKLVAVGQFQKALSKQAISYESLIVKPTAFNTILWNGNVATKEGFYLGDYSFFDTKPISFTFYPKEKPLEVQLSRVEDFKKLQKISEGWYTVSQRENTLYFNDLRFGLLKADPQNPQFAFSYRFDRNENKKLVATEAPKAKRDGKALLVKTFKRMGGN